MINAVSTPSRNETCNCGSGLKYKKCCSNKALPQPSIKTNSTKAQNLIDVYPSFNELLEHEIVPSILSQSELLFVSNKVHLLSTIVDRMCNTMYDLGFFKSTFFFAENDPFDHNTGLNMGGHALIYDASGRTHEVDYIEFMALSKMMFCSFLGIELNYNQLLALSEFKNSSSKIATIID